MMIQRHDLKEVTLLEMRHGKANALDVEMLNELEQVFEEMAGDTQGVVLTGFETVFCAGVDLPRLLESDRAYTQTLIEALDACLRAMVAFPRPLIAAINGHAIAGGLVLACACDYRLLGSVEAKLGVTELAVGVPFPRLALEVVRQAVGPGTARRLVLVADLIDSRQALSMGVVDQVTDRDELISHACEIASKWARIPQATFAITKRQLGSDLEARMDRQDAELAAAVVATWSSDETRAQIGQFVTKTLSRRRS
jgi:enoyl-CoA hydratase